MSHTSSIKSIKIQSISALHAAVAELREKGLNVEMVADAKPRASFADQGGMGQAPYVIKLNDAKYDIGVYQSEGGGYELRTDFWNGSVESVVGAPASCPETREQAKMGRVFQHYAICAAEEQARNQGLQYTRETAENGDMVLAITGY